MKRVFIIFTLICVTTSVYAGDILTLTNGMTFNGEVKKIKDCEIVFKADNNEKYNIPSTDIYSILFEDVDNKLYVNYLESLQSDPNRCLKGAIDAENYHGKQVGHFVLGVLFGPFAMIGTALSNPIPQNGAHTMSNTKNMNIINDYEYLKCYKKKAKGQLIAAEGMGWAAWIIFVLLMSSKR